MTLARRTTGSGRQRLRALAALVAVLSFGPAHAEDTPKSLEYPVKAGLLLNFAKFAEWPAGSTQAESPTVAICVLGSDPFGGHLDAIVRGRTVAGRGIVVRRFQEAEGTESCHVLFIASAEVERVALALAQVREAPVITVGECPEFRELGGVIRLFVEKNHAAFAVNLAPAEATRLKLSSKLLSVARAVRLGIR
jgi:hypothetical protein